MASVLLRSPTGQQVYSDDSSPDHANYLKSGFSVVPQTPPAQSVGSSNNGYTSNDPLIQAQIKAMQQSAVAQSSNPSQLSTPGAPKPPEAPAPIKAQQEALQTRIDPSRASDYENVTQKLENGSQVNYGTAIPKATLISPTGARVVVRTDNKTGTSIPTAQEYFAKGYVLETSAGVGKNASGGTITAPGVSQLAPAAPKPQTASQTQPVAGSSGPGAGFSLPSGYSLINGAQYNTTLKQRAAFDDIQTTPDGKSLYGKPKNQDQGSVASGTTGSNESVVPPPTVPPPPVPSGDKTLNDYLQGFLNDPGANAGATTGAFNQANDGTSTPDLTAQEFQKQLNQMNADRQSQIQKLRDSYTTSLNPSADETEATAALDALIAEQKNLAVSRRMGLSEIAKQPIAMSFVSGQQSAIDRDASIQQEAISARSEPLKARLAAAQAKRAAATDIAKTQLGFEEQDYERYLEQEKPMTVGNSIIRFNPSTKQYDVVFNGASASAPVSVAPGSSLVDPATGKVIYNNPTKDAASSTPDIKEYEFAVGQGYKGTWQDYVAWKNQSDPSSGYQIIADPVSGGIYRVSKNGPEGLIGGGSSNGGGNNDIVSALIEQIQKNPSVLEALDGTQKKIVLAQMAQMGIPIPTPSDTKPMSDTAAKTKGYLTTLQTGLAELRNRMQSNYKMTVVGILTGADRDLSNLVTSLADAFGRIRSGGAVNKDEEARFRSMLVSGMDLLSGSPESASKSIDAMLNEASTAYQAMTGGGIQQTAPGSQLQGGYSQQEIDDALKQGYTIQQIQQLQGKTNAGPVSYGSTGASATGGDPMAAYKIAAAIKQVESGGNYTATGASGEYGAYQFMPGTWSSWAGRYLGNSAALKTKENQDKVAFAHINTLLQQGRTPEQIALIWNGGQPVVKKGVNSKGVKYDSGAYAQKVLAALNQVNQLYANAT